MKRGGRRTKPKNNVEPATFGATKNAAILTARLLELGYGRLSWKLKKRFGKTLQAAHIIQKIEVREVRLYLLQLLFRDTAAYVETLTNAPKDIRERFLGAIRNQMKQDTDLV